VVDAERGEALSMHEPPEPQWWLSDYHEIKTDTDSLHGFAGAVNADVDGNFRPHTTRLFDTYAGGVPFGAKNPSGEVHAAKTRYHECLTGVTEAMTGYINASKILATAITEIAHRYSDADAMARANGQDVQALFAQAIQDAQAATQPHTHGGMRAE
jgi:hypothetical protein